MVVLYLVRHAHADWTPDENHAPSIAGLKEVELVATVPEGSIS